MSEKSDILSSLQQQQQLQLRQLHSKQVKQQHLSLNRTIRMTIAAMMRTPPTTINAICHGCSNRPSPSNQQRIISIIITTMFRDDKIKQNFVKFFYENYACMQQL